MSRRAFTLIELLVVIAIIGLLSTIAVVSLSTTRMNARNTTRKANLAQLYKALELYYSDNNGYPNTSGVWRGACTGEETHPDSGANAWIPNFGSYMAQLPHDPLTNKPTNTDAYCVAHPTAACYLYRSNITDYKLLAFCTPEGTMSATDPFYDSIRATSGWQISTPGAAAW
jgi:prepilin-type N-terminal cleavage/methylation domain-containing protein